MQIKTQNTSRGFTLLELLVVMAIIGILAMIILGALSEARAKARDSARMATVSEIQKALEMYYHNNGEYPLQAFPDNLSNLSAFLVPDYIPAIDYDMTDISGPIYYRPANPPNSYLIYVSRETEIAPSQWGCRAGVGPTVDSGLYPGTPRC